MKKSPRRVFLLAVLVAALSGAVAQADERHVLEGSWTMEVTVTDPPGFPPLKSLLTFTAGGEVLESRRPYFPFTPFGPVLETGGHGAWVKTGRRQFGVDFRFLLQAAPNNAAFPNGEDLGTDRIRLQIERSRDGESFTGIFMSEARDADGNVVFQARGSVSGSRLRVELLQ
jgi:hypothetical protein